MHANFSLTCDNYPWFNIKHGNHYHVFNLSKIALEEHCFLNSIFTGFPLAFCHFNKKTVMVHTPMTQSLILCNWEVISPCIFCDVAIPSLRKTWEDLFHVSSHQKGHVMGKVIIQNAILIINILLWGLTAKNCKLQYCYSIHNWKTSISTK